MKMIGVTDGGMTGESAVSAIARRRTPRAQTSVHSILNFAVSLNAPMHNFPDLQVKWQERRDQLRENYISTLYGLWT